MPLNSNGFIEAVEIHYLDEIDKVLDIDIPMVTLGGAFTINDAPPPSSEYDTGRIVLRDAARADEVPLGSIRGGEYSVRLLPGDYDVHYEVTRAGGTVPANANALIDEFEVPHVIEAPMTRDIDIAAVTLEGEITVDGTAPPSSFNDDGRIVARNAATGDMAVLGSTHDGAFSQVVVPGTYDIHYGQESSSGGVPENTNARLDSVSVAESTTFDVDIPTVPVAGTVTMGGLQPPTSQYDDGRLYLREQETGDSVLLGSTRAGTFSALVVPGTYDVHYVVETNNGGVPVNTDAYVSTVVVALGSPLAVDVPIADIAGALLVNGSAPPVSPANSARLYLRDVATDDNIYVAEMRDGTYGERLVTGRYILYYRGESTAGDIPANSNAGVRCFDVN